MTKDMTKIGSSIGIVAAEICPAVGIVLLGAAAIYGGCVLGEKLMGTIMKKKDDKNDCKDFCLVSRLQ